ncbi:MAG: YihY/virulence factor BrkB family protein [Verrucomicrobia bacterium]|nr:YihY/virulence factor BrkB family protein [Verrucomicrobiota bacterium]
MISPPKHWQHWLRFCKRLFGLFAQSLGRAVQRYGLIDGEQCAASFAYYAFFSLFPLILLCVALATLFVQDREVTAGGILIQIDQYLPLQESDRVLLLHTVQGVIEHGLGAGVLGVVVLAWSSLRFSQALVIGVNRAWELADYNWWKLPLKNLLMIGIVISAIALGLVTPFAFDRLAELFGWGNAVTHLFAGVLPTLVLFYSLLLFYILAPRRNVRFAVAWPAALLGTIALELAQALFGVYVTQIAHFNAIYGAFGSIMALLFWIYVSGVIVIFCGCFAATAHSPEAPSHSQYPIANSQDRAL